MPQVVESQQFNVGVVQVRIFRSRRELGEAAANDAAKLVQLAIEQNGCARLLAATGNSQLDVVDSLTRQISLDWKRVEIFHLDEYVGVRPDHPAGFRNWIRTRLVEKVHPGRVEYLAGDATDLNAEMKRYSTLLSEAPIDLAFVGFGENGHIAFNDPPTADFADPAVVKRVTLDEACRRQQAGEGHFGSVQEVPEEALTVTCSGLFSAKAWISAVPERRKAEAVRNALEGPVSMECPASLIRRHPSASVYLDRDSASLLTVPKN